MYREPFLILIFLVLDTIQPKSGITRTDEKISSETNFTQRLTIRIYKKQCRLNLIQTAL
jgi:hypothetical protein